MNPTKCIQHNPTLGTCIGCVNGYKVDPSTQLTCIPKWWVKSYWLNILCLYLLPAIIIIFALRSTSFFDKFAWCDLNLDHSITYSLLVCTISFALSTIFAEIELAFVLLAFKMAFFYINRAIRTELKLGSCQNWYKLMTVIAFLYKRNGTLWVASLCCSFKCWSQHLWQTFSLQLLHSYLSV